MPMQDTLHSSSDLRPIYFGQPGRQGFGLFHPARQAPAATTGQAVLICPSFGTEEVNAYLTLRKLAESCAQQGVPALRLSYTGCGNAEGDADTPELPDAWIDSIVAAADALRALSGVQRITVLGLRLGALLAALAAPRCGPLRDMIAVAPVISGRAYVREMKALHMASLSSMVASPAQASGSVFESGGFVMAEATHQALAAIDLLKLDAPPAKRMLLIERDDLPGPVTKWAACLEAQGVALTTASLQGYAAMMADPHRCIPPPTLRDIVSARLHEPDVHHGIQTERASLEQDAGLLRDSLSLPATTGPHAVHESPVFLGADPSLMALLSRPQTASTPTAPQAITHSGWAILMLNAGATRAIGPNRLYVPLAREWASEGHAVLRLDIAGLGDSPVHPGKPDNTVYSDTALQDVATALSWLHTQAGVDKVLLLGLCSGAYHALKAVVRDMPADAAIMINPLTYFWKEGMSLDPGTVSEARVAMDMMRHRQSVWRLATWKKVLGGGISVKRLIQIASQTLRWAGHKIGRQLARRLGLPMKEDLGRELQHVAARAVPMYFIFSDSDPGLPMLRTQGGPAVDQLVQQGRLSIQLIAHADHTFTLAAPRAQLHGMLKAIVAAL
ncbi:MAG: alpha/beta hydrolase [Aquabacterium sp.]